jgi:hypothetical protein
MGVNGALSADSHVHFRFGAGAKEERFDGFRSTGLRVKMLPCSHIVPTDTEVVLSFARFCG